MAGNDLPKVTFIIPTLNAARILTKCLDSIICQNYPRAKIEIIISDGGSSDNTLDIAGQYGAKIVHNKEILHEPGKTLATRYATGKVIFFTDADNILTSYEWLRLMVKPYIDNRDIMGFLPQTIPAPDTNPLDKYLGYLCTDPFTWFIYGNTTCGRDYGTTYKPLIVNKSYRVYKFPHNNLPLFGLSQGVGINIKFNRGGIGKADDILAGIKLIRAGGLVAYVPDAGVYHYHVSGIKNYLSKYSWRVKNNLSQRVKGMGITNRTQYFSKMQTVRIYLFMPYALSIVFPVIDSLALTIKHRDIVMLLHFPVTIITALMIVAEYTKFILLGNSVLHAYE